MWSLLAILVSLCTLWAIFITFWIGLHEIIFHMHRKGITLCIYPTIILSLFFDYRWVDTDMIFPTLCLRSNGSTVLLTTCRSLWIIPVAVCTLTPETPIVCCVSDKIHPFKAFVVSLRDYIHHYNIMNWITFQPEVKMKTLKFFSTKN